ncbi:15-hydroxyprostaglandin dehydrogenase [nad(+)] [Holotrichia oblita]|uniref:15-hydroxyprostaglandin dehydrogenase [nad(+)] n=1 Tax=Holotrichia oblita TaxID=644536 RepID=A0ACB9TUT5_HOLOL|nr:15-hydroxyprostaglandin dehydrogenase [nad(+)] [Holotrichia oblita]
MNLSEKVAIVTGGAGGIGKGCAEELLENGIKIHCTLQGVTIADVNDTLGKASAEELNQKYGSSKVLFVKTDVTNTESFENAFSKTIEAYGNVDILINNAGLMNEINWKISIQVNLIGVTIGSLLAIEKYFPKYKSGDKAYIINLSSIAGITPADFCPVYTATKHAVIGLTRSYGLNRHLLEKGIYVMALCPSSTDTPMKDYMRETARYKDLYDEAFAQFSSYFQKTTTIGKAAIRAMEDEDSGSAWFIKDEEIYKVKFPTLEQLIGTK